MLPKAILFDLDDTILSFNGAGDLAWECCCREFVREHPVAFSGGELLERINGSRDWFWGDAERHKWGRYHIPEARRIIAAHALEQLGFVDEPAANAFAGRYSRMQHEMVSLLPDSIPTLDRLREKNIPLALLTNGSPATQRAKLERFGLEPYFDAVLIEGELGFGKPDERVYLLALKMLGMSANDVWMVGDHLIWEVQAPQRLGIYCIWVDRAGRGLPADSPVRPNATVRTIAGLLEL